jgi:transcriptional regulator with XRE-family HTH domain
MARKKKPVWHRRPTFLREWREFRGLTIEEAADRIGIDRTTLGRIETLKLPYNQDFMEKAELAYGVEVSELLNVDPFKPIVTGPPQLIWDKLRDAPKDVQARALSVIEALLKAG